MRTSGVDRGSTSAVLRLAAGSYNAAQDALTWPWPGSWRRRWLRTGTPKSAASKTWTPTRSFVGQSTCRARAPSPSTQAAAALGAAPVDLARRLVARHAPFLVEADKWQGWVLDSIDDLDHDRDEGGDLIAADVSDMALEKLGQRRPYTRKLQLHFAEDAIAIIEAVEARAVSLFRIPGPMRMGFVVPFPGLPLMTSQLLVRRRDLET